MKKFINFIHNYIFFLLAFIGFIHLSFIFWFRFLRERMPRNIPFDCTWYIFILLVVICVTYGYILLRLWAPKDPHPWVIKILSSISFIRKPVDTLDIFIRESYYGFKMVDKIFIFIAKIIENTKYKNIFMFYYSLYIKIYFIPKILLLILFIIDVFHYSRLENFYKYIWLSLIILIIEYLIYTLQKHLDTIINYLDENYELEVLDKDDIDLMLIGTKEDSYLYTTTNVMKSQVSEIICLGEKPYKIRSHVIRNAPFELKENSKKNIYNDLKKNTFTKLYYPLIYIAVFLDYIGMSKNTLKDKEINQYIYTNIGVYIGYLIGWSYIFMVTFFNWNIVYNIMVNSMEILEPFSGSNIFF